MPEVKKTNTQLGRSSPGDTPKLAHTIQTKHYKAHLGYLHPSTIAYVLVYHYQWS